MQLVAPHFQMAMAASTGDTTVGSWLVSAKRGTQSGVGVSISGQGAYARLVGEMTFQIYSLDDSQTYNSLKTSNSFGAGVSAFWGWLGISANVEANQEAISSVFKEVQNTQKVNGEASFDLEVTGLYPNVQVSASAFVLVLQVTDSSGNTFDMVSGGDPVNDTGAQDQNGNSLPVKNNSSTITLAPA